MSSFVLVNHYAGSPSLGMVYRTFHMAKEIQKAGHEVTIVAASFAHVRQRQPRLRSLIDFQTIDGVRFLFLKTPSYRMTPVGRLLNMAVFSLLLCILGRRIARACRPDVLIASSPQPFIIFGARRIARISHARLILDVRDLWPLTLLTLGKISRWNPLILGMRVAETVSLRVSDAIITSLPKGGEYFHDRGYPSQRIVYLPNGIEVPEDEAACSESTPPEASKGVLSPVRWPEVFESLRSRGKFTVGYLGAHGLANALDVLVEGLALLEKDHVALVTFGHGPFKPTLERLAREKGIEAHFLDPVPRSQVQEILRKMDVVYLGGRRNDELYRFGISPTKLADYMLSARAIVHAVSANCDDLVKEAGCGESVPMEDAEALAAAIERLRGLTPERRMKLGSNGREYVLKNMQWKFLMAGLFEKLRAWELIPGGATHVK